MPLRDGYRWVFGFLMLQTRRTREISEDIVSGCMYEAALAERRVLRPSLFRMGEEGHHVPVPVGLLVSIVLGGVL